MKRKFWRIKKYGNPFLPRRTEEEIHKKKKRKKRLIFFIIILTLSGIIYFFIYAKIFLVNKILITGVNNSEIVNELTLFINKQLTGYKYLFLPENNIFLIDVREVTQDVNENIVLDDLAIKKKYPQTLEIEAKEKIPVLLWQEGEIYYYVDKAGVVMGALSLDKVKYDLPIINRGTTTEVVVAEKIIEENDIILIKSVLEIIKEKIDNLHIRSIIAKEISNSEMEFMTTENWYFIVNINEDINKQIDNLAKFLKQKAAERASLEYIDLRIAEKIFYKTRKQ